MLWKGIKVNINNYQEVFKDYPKSIREVIRSAILDGTPVEGYIDALRDKPYLFWGVKMALDDGIPVEWVKKVPSATLLKFLVDMVKRGINIRPLMSYLDMGFSPIYYDYIFRWYEDGVALDRYDFGILPGNLLKVFHYGLALGYPMYIFNNGVHYSEDYVMACLKILSNGRKVDRFLDGKWEVENLDILARYSKSKYFETLMEYVMVSITPAVLEEMYECCKVGMPLEDISAVDEDGLYVYSPVHIGKIREAYINNWDYRVLMNPEFSLDEVFAKYSELELNANKRLSGKLRKG